MGNRRQPLHLMRSIVAFNRLRRDGLDLAAVTAALHDGGHFDKGVITRRALGRCWRGLRALRFDPLGSGCEVSEVHALDSTFWGFGYVFFHPLFSLLAQPLRSTEAYRSVHQGFPDTTVRVTKSLADRANDDDRLIYKVQLTNMRRINARSALSHRHRIGPAAAPSSSLAGVHQALLQLHPPLRNELMQPSRLDVADLPKNERPWVRRSRSLDDELSALARSPRLDGLAAALGLAIEAAHIGREECFVAHMRYLHRQTKAMLKDPLFAGVAPQLVSALRMLSGCPPVLETDIVEAQIAALPQSWVDGLSGRAGLP